MSECSVSVMSSCCNHSCTTTHEGNNILNGPLGCFAIHSVKLRTVSVTFLVDGCFDQLLRFRMFQRCSIGETFDDIAGRGKI